MAKRLNNQTIGAVLQQIIQVNKLGAGMDQIDVKEAWRQLMGNGVNTYTKMSTPFFNASTCGFCETPPKIVN